MPGGRPTDYTPELLEKAKDYLENYQSYDDLVPSVAGLADALGMSRETMYAWAKDPEKQEFSYTLRLLDNRQHRKLLTGGLGGDMNAAIVKLMLHNHGYSDKTENKTTISLEEATEEELDRRLSQLASDAE